MNIDLIIEALEDYENSLSYWIVQDGGAYPPEQMATLLAALAEARKLKEPCVFTRIDGWATFNTGCGVYSNLSATDYCPGCGRKVKYED
jgi:hypothetical protein